ncbi:MAG: hypothetical protein ACREVO_00600 [Steroidobacteraceae bacterium]
MATLILTLGGVVLVFWLLWLAPNLFDERLTPAAAALLAPRSDPLPDNDNLFVAFVGFSAPSGRSTYGGGSPATNLTLKGNMQAWGWLTSSLWSTAKRHRAEIAALMGANQELYRRYLALHELRGYFDSARPGASSPYAYVSPDVRTLFLADAAVSLQTGTPAQKEAALADLQADVRMWKAVLDGYGGLYSKVIAAISLHADFLLLGDMVTDHDFDPAPFGDRWTTLLTPFELQDWKIGAAYRWEMLEAAPLFKGMARADVTIRAPGTHPVSWWQRVDDRLSAQFFKLHATENLQAERIQRLSALADGDPGNFIERRDAFRSWQQRRYPAISRASYYNPVGKSLLAIVPQNEDDYAARVYDVAAFQRLVFLAYQLRLRCIGSQDVSAFMQQHPAWATHPIDAKPFHWDPASGELGVLPIGQNARKARFSLKLVDFPHCPRN